jgi:hypothetical protein
MTKPALIVVAALALTAACSAEDDCDLGATSRLLPAVGCCSDDGFCLWPPEYRDECRSFQLAECHPEVVYPPRFEGQEPWVACPALEDGQAFTPCPESWPTR